MVEKERIIICSKCEGAGIVHCKELIDYHNGLYDQWTEKCPKCKGSGRLLEKTIVKVVPYKPLKAKKR